MRRKAMRVPVSYRRTESVSINELFYEVIM